MNTVKRGFVPKDYMEFGIKNRMKMQRAAEEICYLLNRDYEIKSASVFVGNHYMLSERQRLALARMLTPKKKLQGRLDRQILYGTGVPELHIDGFNTIITLEVALSDSLLIKGMDGTIRDMAGLRGTYRIVDKTEKALELLLNALEEKRPDRAVIYLDSPVSNSGRLKGFILEKAEAYDVNIEVEVIPDVDRVLSGMEYVVTADGIILDHCKSWYNLNSEIIRASIENPWIYALSVT